MKKTILILSLCSAAQPLQAASSWRTISLYTTGMIAIGSCIVGTYYLWKQYNKPCEPVLVQPTLNFKEQIETHFNNFACLIQNSHDDLKYVIEINKMIDDLQKDESSEELLCTILRHKKPGTGETLLAIASKSSNIVTRTKFEKLYNFYNISPEIHKNH